MKRVRYRQGYKQTIARDAHAPETVYVETVTDDKEGLERNKKIRAAGLLKQGQRVPVIDEHAELTAAFQFPTVMDYKLAKARYPEEFAWVEEGGEASIRAGEKLAFLLPEYVTMVKRGDRL